MRKALEDKLAACQAQGTTIDSLTFSGDGEPTLHPDFPAIIDLTLALRDRYYPQARVSVLTNAMRISRPEVREALRKVDNPILKLDAETEAQAAIVNRPEGHYSVEEIVQNMALFEGNFVLQTMFLKGDGWETADWVEEWMTLVRRLRPREVMVYTIARETPMQGLRKYTAAEMRELVRPLLEENYHIIIKE